MKRKMLVFIFIWMIMFILVPNLVYASAKFETGDLIKVTDTIDGSGFYAGNEVDVHAAVKGIVGTLGKTVMNAGRNDYVISVGGTVGISSMTENDVFAAGSDIILDSSSMIGRDSFLAANRIQIKGIIQRDLYATGSDITIENATIYGNLYLNAKNLTIKENVIIHGKIKLNDTAVKNIGNPNLTIDYYKGVVQEKQEVTFISSLLSSLQSLVGIILLFMFLYKIFPGLFETISSRMSDNKMQYLSLLGYGLMTLFIIPISSIILIISILGVQIGLFILSFFLSILFMSIFVVGYMIGTHLHSKWPQMNKMVAGVLGITLLFLVEKIPFIGVLIVFAVALIALGAIYQLISLGMKKA